MNIAKTFFVKQFKLLSLRWYFCILMDWKSSLEMSIKGENFEFLPSKSLWHEDTKTLFIADLHLGKVNHFRKNGLPIPAHVANKNLQTLTLLLNDKKPKTVYFMGDLFHSALNTEWHKFTTWIQAFNKHISFVLIVGNHDILPLQQYKDILELQDSLVWNSQFVLSHEPILIPNLFTICGHIHPGIELQTGAKTKVKLPCFALHTKQLVLPAFGEFTGTVAVNTSFKEAVLILNNKVAHYTKN